MDRKTDRTDRGGNEAVTSTPTSGRRAVMSVKIYKDTYSILKQRAAWMDTEITALLDQVVQEALGPKMLEMAKDTERKFQVWKKEMDRKRPGT